MMDVHDLPAVANGIKMSCLVWHELAAELAKKLVPEPTVNAERRFLKCLRDEYCCSRFGSMVSVAFPLLRLNDVGHSHFQCSESALVCSTFVISMGCACSTTQGQL